MGKNILVLYAMFCRSLFVLLVIVFPVLLRFTAFGIFKHFLIMSLVATVQYGKNYSFRWSNTENYDFWLNNIQKKTMNDQMLKMNFFDGVYIVIYIHVHIICIYAIYIHIHI
jgi:hypothetical protein